MYAKSVIANAPTLPLFDVNDVFVREVTADECQQLIETGQAEPVEPFGIKLTLPRDYCRSASCLTARDAQLIAGEYGDSEEAQASRGKLAHWKAAQ